MSVSVSITPSPGSFSLALLADDRSGPGIPQLLSDSQPPLRVRLNAANCAGTCVVNCYSRSAGLRIAPSSFSLTQGEAAELSVWVPFLTEDPRHEASILCASGPASAVITVEVAPTRWPLFDDVWVVLADGTARSAWSPQRLNASDSRFENYAMSAVNRVSNNTAPFSVVVTDGATIHLVAAQQTLPLPPFTPGTQVLANNAPCQNVTVEAEGWMLRLTLPRRHELCPDVMDDTSDCGYVHMTLISPSDDATLGTTLSCPPFCPHDMPGTIPVGVDAGDGVAITPALLEGANSLHPPVPLQLATLPSTGFYVTQACSAAGYVDASEGACLNASDPRHAQCAFGAGGSCQPCPAGALCPGGYRAWPVVGYYTAVESSGSVLPCPPPASSRCRGWNVSIASVQCGDEYAQSHLCSACAPSYYITLDGTCSPCPSSHVTMVDMLQPVAVFAAGLLAACGILYLCLLLIVRVRGVPIADLPMQLLQLIAWAFVVVQVVSQVGQAAVPGLPVTVLRVYEQLAVFQFQGAALPSGCIPDFPFTNEVAAMSLGLGLLVFTAACGFGILRRSSTRTSVVGTFSRHERFSAVAAKTAAVVAPNLFYSCVMGLFVMYATVTNSVVSLLYCTSVSVSALAYDKLMGLNDVTGGVGLVPLLSNRYRAAVTVSLLHANPSIVCYEGPHLIAGTLAWVTLLVYCVAFPLLSVWLVYRRMSRMLNQTPNLARSRPSIKVARPSITPPPPTLLLPVQPTRRAPSWLCGVNVPPVPQSILSDTLLAPFIWCEYHPHLYWFFLVDRVYFIVLAVVQYVIFDSITRFAITFLVLICMAVLLAYHRPYIVPWNLVVKLYAIILCALAAVLNLLTAQHADVAIQPLSFLVVVASAGLFIALLITFLRYALKKKHAPVLAPTKCDALDNTFSQVHENPLLRPSSASSFTAEKLLASPRRPSHLPTQVKPMKPTTTLSTPNEVGDAVRPRAASAHRPSKVARRSTFVAVPMVPMAPRRQATTRPM
jgi:hypothetical protein